MGQAKQRKAEIDALKATGPKKEHGDAWSAMRPIYVAMIKEDQEAYMKHIKHLVSTVKGDDFMTAYKQADRDRIDRACYVGLNLVRTGVASIAQVKEAAWQGFNGLLEACTVEMNIQHELGLPVSKLDISQFVFTGKDAVDKAKKAGLFV